jgi:hypothetical protein
MRRHEWPLKKWWPPLLKLLYKVWREFARLQHAKRTRPSTSMSCVNMEDEEW